MYEMCLALAIVKRNKQDNCVVKSRSLSNDAMMRRKKRDECATDLILYAIMGQNKRGK